MKIKKTGDSGRVVLGIEMKWKEVREISVKLQGGRLMSFLKDENVIFGNGHVKGAKNVKTQGFTSFFCQNIVKIWVLMKLMETRVVSDRIC